MAIGQQELLERLQRNAERLKAVNKIASDNRVMRDTTEPAVERAPTVTTDNAPLPIGANQGQNSAV